MFQVFLISRSRAHRFNNNPDCLYCCRFNSLDSRFNRYGSHLLLSLLLYSIRPICISLWICAHYKTKYGSKPNRSQAPKWNATLKHCAELCDRSVHTRTVQFKFNRNVISIEDDECRQCQKEITERNSTAIERNERKKRKERKEKKRQLLQLLLTHIVNCDRCRCRHFVHSVVVQTRFDYDTGD